MLKAIGFILVSTANSRRDKCNLYLIEMTSAAWSKISHEIPN